MNPGIFGLPEQVVTEQWFYAFGGAGTMSTTKNWQKWEKPKGARFVVIWLLGAGGGGGGGFSAAAGATRGGGGGGGSGAYSQVMYLASMLPDVLWVQVPRGGLGGAAGAGGGVGGRAVVSIAQQILPAWVVGISSGGDAGGGGGGTGAAGGNAGAAAGASSSGNSNYMYSIAIMARTLGGVLAAAGGAPNIAGIATNLSQSNTGGAGGAGVTATDLVGGAVTVTNGIIPTLSGGAPGGGAGTPGRYYNDLKPLLTTGGSGGGSSNTGTGGRGGDGAYGSGGGGGGGGVTGGAGGDGGDGLVIIATF